MMISAIAPPEETPPCGSDSSPSLRKTSDDAVLMKELEKSSGSLKVATTTTSPQPHSTVSRDEDEAIGSGNATNTNEDTPQAQDTSAMMMQQLLQRMQRQESAIQQLQDTVQSQNETLQVLMTTMQAGFASILATNNHHSQPQPAADNVGGIAPSYLRQKTEVTATTEDSSVKDWESLEIHQLVRTSTGSVANKADCHANNIKDNSKKEEPQHLQPREYDGSFAGDVSSLGMSAAASKLLGGCRRNANRATSFQQQQQQQQQQQREQPLFGSKKSLELLIDESQGSSNYYQDHHADHPHNHDDNCLENGNDKTLNQNNTSSCRGQVANGRSSTSPSIVNGRPSLDKVPVPPSYMASPCATNNQRHTRLNRGSSDPMSTGWRQLTGVPRLPPRLPVRDASVSVSEGDDASKFSSVDESTIKNTTDHTTSTTDHADGDDDEDNKVHAILNDLCASNNTRTSRNSTGMGASNHTRTSRNSTATLPAMPTRRASILPPTAEQLAAFVDDDDTTASVEHKGVSRQVMPNTARTSLASTLPPMPTRYASVSNGLDKDADSVQQQEEREGMPNNGLLTDNSSYSFELSEVAQTETTTTATPRISAASTLPPMPTRYASVSTGLDKDADSVQQGEGDPNMTDNSSYGGDLNEEAKNETASEILVSRTSTSSTLPPIPTRYASVSNGLDKDADSLQPKDDTETSTLPSIPQQGTCVSDGSDAKIILNLETGLPGDLTEERKEETTSIQHDELLEYSNSGCDLFGCDVDDDDDDTLEEDVQGVIPSAVEPKPQLLSDGSKRPSLIQRFQRRASNESMDLEDGLPRHQLASRRGSKREIYQQMGLQHLHVSCITLDSAFVDEMHEWIGNADDDEGNKFEGSAFDGSTIATREQSSPQDKATEARVTITSEVMVNSKKLADHTGDTGVYSGYVSSEDDNVPNGTGTLCYYNGKVYKGEWQNGFWHGQGLLLSANGDSYDGDFVLATRHGHGLYKYENGDAYEGDFNADKPHGKGTFRFADGSVYHGGFIFGSFEGEGWYEFEGGVYEGEWKAGCFDGYGVLVYGDIGSYIGHFEAGKPNGPGEEVSADGTRRKGLWKQGELVQEDFEEDEQEEMQNDVVESSTV